VKAASSPQKRAALAAFFCFCATTSIWAQESAAPKPAVKVDDRWVYRHTDRRFKPPVYVYELRVSFVDDRVIHAVVERQAGKSESDATWTAEWNGVVGVDEGVIDLQRGMLQFPLVPGREYSAAWDVRRARAGDFQVRHDRQVKVVGWEEIEVPAGRFRALKVQAEGSYRRIDRPFSGPAQNTFWYVPQVKRWVKSVYKDAELEIVEELYFYRVQ
jgi:hypothetical protein